jgi:DNA-binding transcriptional ArsR family regulator
MDELERMDGVGLIGMAARGPKNRNSKEDLEKQVRELSGRIDALERALRGVTEPIVSATRFAERYVRFVGSLLGSDDGSSSLLFPGVKDPMDKDILFVLLRIRSGNVSQITRALRDARGRASRSIVRARLSKLEEQDMVSFDGSLKAYTLSDDAKGRLFSLLVSGEPT